MKWLAPAKINLSLRVLGRREDGYHELETLMAPLSLADEIIVEPRREERAPDGKCFELICSDPSLPTNKDNLALRAAELFRQRMRFDIPPTRLTLLKNIPHGAGLGGGSSDAATVLLALNEMFDARLLLDDLAALAAELGSDVPFFVYRSVAICGGRGEKVQPTRISERLPLLLLKPEFPVPTPWAYQRWAASREIPGVIYTPQSLSWGTLTNDLERPVFEKYVMLAELKMWLLGHLDVTGALMSGSGSTLFAVLRDERAAKNLILRARERFGDLWSCLCWTV